jgi:hypothetical protein
VVLLLHNYPKGKATGDRKMRRDGLKFKLICPDCNAVIVTESPEMMIWELCPACKHYVWDMNDVLMADAYEPEKPRAVSYERHA